MTKTNLKLIGYILFGASTGFLLFYAIWYPEFNIVIATFGIPFIIAEPIDASPENPSL